MKKEVSQFPTQQIYSKKRNIDSVISIRSIQSNKSSESTKARSNISTTLNDISTLTSFAFNLTNALLITNTNNSITSSLISSFNVIDLEKGSQLNDNQFHSKQSKYIDSCVDSIDKRIQGALCLSSIDKELQDEVISLSSHKGISTAKGSRKSMNTDELIGTNGSNGSELKVLRINKQALHSIRNNSNDIKIPSAIPSSNKKDKESVIRIVKGNRRFHSPLIESNGNQSNCIIECKEERSVGKNHSKAENATVKEHHCSQITNITPVSIKIKVYNTNINRNKHNETSGNQNNDNKTIVQSNKSTLVNKNGKRILPLPKKGKEYVKSSSPKPIIPTEMHKEMNGTYINKTNTKNQSLGLNQKSSSRRESPVLNKGQLIQNKPQTQLRQQAHQLQSALPNTQPQSKIRENNMHTDICIRKKKNKSKPNTISIRAPLNPKPTPASKKTIPLNIRIRPQISKSHKDDKLNLSCDELIIPTVNPKRPKIKPTNSELNKSYDSIKQEYWAFDLDNDIFNVINNSSIIVQDKPSKKRTEFNSNLEQVKNSLDRIRKSNEINVNSIDAVEEWEEGSANFQADQTPDYFDRFSFHNKIVE